MYKKALLAATAVLFVHSQASFASSAADEVAILKQKEQAAKAQIAQLQAKIKALEAEKKAAEEVAARPALAMELRNSYKAAPRIPTWAGLYFGAGISRSRTNVDQGTATQFATDGVSSTTELLPLEKDVFQNGGHLLAGYRWQSGKVVAGLEGDYTFNDRATVGPGGLWGPEGGSCGVAFTGNFVCGTVTPFGSFETLGHVRGIVGYDFSPRVMGYLSAGLAIGRNNGLGSHAGFALREGANPPVYASVDSTSANKMIFGYSLGLGVEMKTSENLSARFEYIRDTYQGVATPGAIADRTLGTDTVTMTVPGQKAKVVSEAIRAALIYRLDPDAPGESFRDLLARFTTDPRLTDGSWTGFYVGGGLSQHNYKVADSQAGASITIDDANTPGVDYSNRWTPFLKDSNNAYHLLFGYRAQMRRFVAGVEFDYELDAGKQFFTGFKSPGQFGGINVGSNFNCYDQFQPEVVCVGLGMQSAGNISVQSKRQIRLTGGFLITPDVLAYGAYGWAWGVSPSGIGASSAGFVQVGANAPLLGAATVTRNGIQSKLKGHTFGGGVEFRASEHLSFRGEYMHERYTWNHAPIGGAGFGGTSGNITVSSFISMSEKQKITNDTYRFSAIFKFGNLPEP